MFLAKGWATDQAKSIHGLYGLFSDIFRIVCFVFADPAIGSVIRQAPVLDTEIRPFQQTGDRVTAPPGEKYPGNQYPGNLHNPALAHAKHREPLTADVTKTPVHVCFTSDEVVHTYFLLSFIARDL